MADSRKVVVAALAGNLAIAVCKFGAAALATSTATLAEAVHSLADSGNQALLLVGMSLAMKPATKEFPFGRSAELYFWPFVVALILFSVGGAFAIYEGIHRITDTPDPNESSEMLTILEFTFRARNLTYLVLVASIVFELLSFRVAYREFKKLAAGRPWKTVILEARDPTIPLVLSEDATALVGLVLALAAVGLADITGNHLWDAAGSITIGIVLCIVAYVLASVTHKLLIGAGATEEDQRRVLAIVEGVEGVDRVTQLLTLHLGPDVVVLALKVGFEESLSVREVEEVTDRIEASVREHLPHMRKIFVEPDSDGDGRGLVHSLRASRLSGA